jgi:twitching motility protein PilT
VTRLEELLKLLAESGGTDLVVKAGAAPQLRVGESLRSIGDGQLAPADVPRLLDGVAPTARLDELEETGETEFAHGVPGVGRFRISAFRQRGSVALTCRRVVPGIPSPQELGLPAIVDRICAPGPGLVLVTGAASSGVTTTIAALVDHVNTNRTCQIVTVEHPIEYLHPDKRSVVLQREFGTDTRSVAQAIQRAARHGADVVAVGQVIGVDQSDAEVVRALLDAAEAGVLVFASLPALSSSDALIRLVEATATDDRRRLRAILARSLRAALCQRLLDRADGRGKAAAFEILLGTSKVQECIADDRLGDIARLVAEGEYHGMQTIDRGLADLARDGVVTLSEAVGAADDPEEVKLAVDVLVGSRGF